MKLHKLWRSFHYECMAARNITRSHVEANKAEIFGNPGRRGRESEVYGVGINRHGAQPVVAKVLLRPIPCVTGHSVQNATRTRGCGEIGARVGNLSC